MHAENPTADVARNAPERWAGKTRAGRGRGKPPRGHRPRHGHPHSFVFHRFTALGFGVQKMGGFLPPVAFSVVYSRPYSCTPKPRGRSGRTSALPYPPASKANYRSICLYCSSVKDHCKTAFTRSAPQASHVSRLISMSSSVSLSLYPRFFLASFMTPPYETKRTP